MAALQRMAPQPASETASREPLAANSSMMSMASPQARMMSMGTEQATLRAFSMTWALVGSSLGIP